MQPKNVSIPPNNSISKLLLNVLNVVYFLPRVSKKKVKNIFVTKIYIFSMLVKFAAKCFGPKFSEMDPDN